MKRFALILASLLAIASAGLPAAHAAVTVTITPSRALTGTQIFSFSSRARGVTTSNIALRVSGTTANLPATLSCRNGSGASVSCSTSNDIRRALLRSTAPLVAGQVYTAIANPSGATAFTDAGGGSIAGATKAFRASMVEEETSAGTRTTWRSASASTVIDGSFVMERTPGATAAFSFRGTSLAWYTRTGPDQGIADVYIDGRLNRSVNNFAPTTTDKVRRTISGLANARHRATIRVRGEAGSPAGTGTWIVLDAFDQGGSRFVPVVTYRWGSVAADAASGDRYVRSDARMSRVSFRFRGKGIDWYTITGPDRGQAEIWIDGARARVVDLYAASTTYGARQSIAGLTDAEHTIEVRALGTKNSAASAASVAVDRFVVRYPSVAVFRDLGVWVDVYDYGLDPATVVPVMKDKGVRTIWIQTARYSTVATMHDATKLGRWIETAHANGMKVVGWYLPAYGDNTSNDLEKLRAIVTFRSPAGQALDGMGIDIEHVPASSSYAVTRDEFNAGITAVLGSIRRYAGNTYPISSVPVSPLHMDLSPSSWAGFPWASLGRFTDAVAPMAYWPTWCSKEAYWSRTDAEGECPTGYARENVRRSRELTGVPVYLIGGVGDRITDAELDRFTTSARVAGAIGCSIYDYRTTASSHWTYLSRCNV